MMQRMKIFLVATLNVIRNNFNLCSQLQKKSCDDQFQSPSNHQNFKPVFFFHSNLKKEVDKKGKKSGKMYLKNHNIICLNIEILSKRKLLFLMR